MLTGLASLQPGGAMSQTLTPVRQELGAIVSDFHVSAVSGGIFTLRTVLEHKRGALVVFWSSMCSHCVRYDGYLNTFRARHPELGLLAIASRKGETANEVKTTIRNRALSFPVALDPGGAVARRWFTQQTPRVFLINASHILLYRGAIDNYKYPDDIEYAAYLEPAIAEFLSGRPLSRTESASFGCAIESVYYKFPKAL
jgi:hypothetical protein